MVSASRDVPVREPWWERNNPPNMKTITRVQDFVDELVSYPCFLAVVYAARQPELPLETTS